MSGFVLALDQGTTSSRALLFDASGAVVAQAQQEFTQLFPQPGWVEHDPAEILSSQIAVARQAVAAAGIGAGEVAAVGIANQRETTIVWDRRSGEPVYNAIVWQDRRTSAGVDRLVADGYADLFLRRTGLVLDAYFSGTKLAWILDHVADGRARAAAGELAFGTVDSWLAYRLSGGALHLTDATNASRTLLYNIHRGEWDTELLAVLEVPAAVLPEVRDSSAVYGEATGLLERPVPLAGIAGDQQAAAVGQALFSPGLAKNTYGTGCFLLAHTGAAALISHNRLLTTVASQLAGRREYALEGSVFIGGAVVQWLRDGLGLITHAAEIEALAATVSDTGGVYLVPAFAGLGAPYWDQDARGTISGLTRGTGAAHLARAALEAIAFQVADVARAMEQDLGAPLRELRVDGGAAGNDLLLQLQADLLDLPVVRPRNLETTAWGAALLAGLAVGVWRDRSAAAELWQPQRRFEPRMAAAERQHKLAGWAEAVARCRSGAADPAPNELTSGRGPRSASVGLPRRGGTVSAHRET